jgi:competence protein ComEC
MRGGTALDAGRRRVPGPASRGALSTGGAPADGARKENDRGCVIRVCDGWRVGSVAADVEALGESEMVQRTRRRCVRMARRAAHGSKTSSTAAFVDDRRAERACCRLGYRNRFRHPHETVVARYAERGVALHRTDFSGALHVVLPAAAGRGRGRGRSREVRYWSERRSLPEAP